MLFAVALLALVASSLAAVPRCEPNSFCYWPDTYTSFTITRAGEYLNIKIWDQKSILRNVSLVTRKGQKVVIGCGTDPQVTTKLDDGTSCRAQLNVDQFEKDDFITVKLTDSYVSTSFSLEGLLPPRQEGLTKQQRRQFSKAHAILMIIGWLFFVPTGFLFARLGKEFFKGQLLFGTAVWFQVHRAANFMGVVCICTSMICIFISTQWTWKGTGSQSKYWTEVHTDLGVISTVLAVAQPLNSLLRCGPSHSKRYLFNWAHRIVGVVAYTLALTTIIIAAVQFKRIWNEPLLELVLVCLPIVICLVASIVFSILDSERFRSKPSYGAEDSLVTPLITDVDFDENAKPVCASTEHILRLPVVFWATGVFFCIAVALSLLVVNGYKNV